MENSLIPEKDYQEKKLPYVTTEYGVHFPDGTVLPCKDRRHAESLAGVGGGRTAVSRSVSAWLECND